MTTTLISFGPDGLEATNDDLILTNKAKNKPKPRKKTTIEQQRFATEQVMDIETLIKQEQNKKQDPLN